MVLAAQIMWSEDVEAALQSISNAGDNNLDPLKRVLGQVESTLTVLADSVLQEQPALRRRKLEHLINEFVHKRTVTRKLVQSRINHPKAFEWLCQMRFYFDPKQTDTLKQLSIYMANAKFQYGFEYLGVQDRLVQTPLTDRCYLTMTQALESRLGGSPFGPAGTGKTESVKALGHQLGRFVLVFNCDETFDFQAMGRIFVGLCQVCIYLIKNKQKKINFATVCLFHYRSELGDVSTNLTVLKSVCFPLFPNKCKPSKRP